LRLQNRDDERAQNLELVTTAVMTENDGTGAKLAVSIAIQSAQKYKCRLFAETSFAKDRLLFVWPDFSE